MSRYIDADAVLKIIADNCPHDKGGYNTEEEMGAGAACYYIRKDVENIPTADVVEVRHGVWVVDAYNGDEIVRIPYAVHEHNEPYCSLCGSYALLDGKEDYVPSNFCPRCGAKMDGERSENGT